jgi:hypothetical protein
VAATKRASPVLDSWGDSNGTMAVVVEMKSQG